MSEGTGSANTKTVLVPADTHRVERTMLMMSPQGLHLRAAAQVVRMVRSLRTRLTVDVGKETPADAGSILDLLRLGATKGTQMTIRAEGEDAEKAVQRIQEMFADGGGI